MNESVKWITLKDGRRIVINDYMNDKIRNGMEKVNARTIKQGHIEYLTMPYKYGDEAFIIKYRFTDSSIKGKGQHSFIYDNTKNEVLTAYKKDGKYVPNNWGKMTNVDRTRWMEMVKRPEDGLIPWVEGAYLD